MSSGAPPMVITKPRVNAQGLSIRDVSRRTGVEPPTLRMWEERHGFPDPDRLPSGHRRYSERDVELIMNVVRARSAGLRLRAAIENAMRVADAAAASPPVRSIHAGLRTRRPDLVPYVVPKHALVALSHAIEDECLMSAQRALLFGSFQRERFYRHSESRWRELARTADHAFVLADFPEAAQPDDGPAEVPVAGRDPIAREWNVVCEARGFAALLTASERPGQNGGQDQRRCFEVIWSVDAKVVREAAVAAAGIVERSAPHLARGLAERIQEPLEPSGSPYELVTRLTNRMVAYVVGGEEPTWLPGPPSFAEE
jgi:MerR family transcriptional regulator, light-induced transcriptional regulator